MLDDEYGEERLLTSTKSDFDAEENILRPKFMKDYVGQDKVKELLTVYMEAAKSRGEALDHVLRVWVKRRSRILSQIPWAHR